MGVHAWRIIELSDGLKKASPRLGYTATKARDKVVQYTVHTLVLGDVAIPVKPGREHEAEERLLKELENLAHHYKPSLLLPKRQHLPAWLLDDEEALDFVLGVTPDDAWKKVYRFGEPISFEKQTGLAGDTIPVTVNTRRLIVYVWATGVEAFRYLPVDEKAYDLPAAYEAAMDWNRTMHTWVEEQKIPPTVARDKLAVLNRELHEKLMLELAKHVWPGKGDVIKHSGNVLKDCVQIISRWHR